MYNCPTCGGHIRYDIPSAKIHCDSCDSSFDPYALDKELGGGKDAEEQKTYETTLFTCPHCGGEITSADVTAASFCTYCGSPVVLGSRISREKRPALIIPFMKTKEECKEAYRRKMRQAFFVPKELQDPEYLEKFRGIYIPYWLFDVQFHGVSSIMGSKEHREGDYIVRTEYELRGDLDAAYPNIYYDASSSFDDSIGETIAPYDSENLRPFTPSMLCGFFADTSDVESSVYKGDAETFARQEAALALSKQPAYRNFSPGSRQPFRVDAEMQKARLSMFPVWFLTWRKDDRVAYAIANGLTGKISADLPIDYGKYTVFSILTAVPIFLLLNLFLTVSAAHTLLVTSFLGLFSLILYQRQLGIIRDRKEHTYDKGYQTLQKRNQMNRHLSGIASDPAEDDSRRKFSRLFRGLNTEMKDKSSSVFIAAIALIVIAVRFLSISSEQHLPLVLMAVAAAATLFCAISIHIIYSAREVLPGLGTILSSVLALVITILWPIGDQWYYLGAIVSLIGIGLNLFGILRRYNDQTMRPLPDYVHREGGDMRA